MPTILNLLQLNMTGSPIGTQYNSGLRKISL
jgi:hypothetical protein